MDIQKIIDLQHLRTEELASQRSTQNTERWPRRAIAQELTFQDWRALEGAIEPARKRLLHIHSNDLRPLYDVQADFLVVMDASQKIPDDGGALRCKSHGKYTQTRAPDQFKEEYL